MRTTQTLILRLLVDSEKPGKLCGGIRVVASGEELCFTSEQNLLALLHSLWTTEGKPSIGQAGDMNVKHPINDH